MAMTTEEMLVFFGEEAEHTRTGMEAAEKDTNYYLATLNCRESMKCRMMQGLISWRLDRDPTDYFSAAIQTFWEDCERIAVIDNNLFKLSDVNSERVPFLCSLIGIENRFGGLLTEDLESDRLLDAVIGGWLFGSWDGQVWESGISQLQKPRHKLCLKTYELYRVLAHARFEEAPALIEQGEKLFTQRGNSSFFSGGDQTEGGNGDNDVTVDYRLAAIAKKIGYTGNSMHLWRW